MIRPPDRLVLFFAQYDLKIVVRNMAGAIVKLEAQSDGSTEWTPLEKMDTMHWSVKGQNFEAMHAIAGKGLINLRMTGIDGQQIVQTKISMKVDKWQMGSVQFGCVAVGQDVPCQACVLLDEAAMDLRRSRADFL